MGIYELVDIYKNDPFSYTSISVLRSVGMEVFPVRQSVMIQRAFNKITPKRGNPVHSDKKGVKSKGLKTSLSLVGGRVIVQAT